MSESRSSYRQILKSSSIIGGASVVNIVVGLVRTKVLAVLLGPAGVGLAGLLTSIMGTASTVAGMGMCTSGVRQVAEAASRDDVARMVVVRRALWFATLVLGALGSLILWLMREPVAQGIFGTAEKSSAVGWLAFGVFFTVVGGSQGAMLQGMRRIADMASAGIIGSIVGTIMAVGCVLTWGVRGIVAYIIVAPLSSFVIAALFLRRIPRVDGIAPWSEVKGEIAPLLRLGAMLMLSGLMSTVTQLLVRTIINRELGMEANGLFQAAWTISMTYIGFVLGSMAADYYPRLTAAIHDKAQANQLVNEQIHVALLLAGPVLVGMLSLAPLVINILYAKAFSGAVDILRWQIIGDLFKIIAWPLGFIILASGAGKIYFLTETSWNVFYMGIVWSGIKTVGLVVTGMSFFLSYSMYLIICWFVARRLIGFSFDKNNFHLVIKYIGIVSSVFVSGLFWPKLTMVLGSMLTVVLFIYSFNQLADMTGVKGPVAAIARKTREFVGGRLR
ncbi:O-antigen translocase [Geobacter sp. AOG1]|uniref:O-antigen translocase n=1 Tax=Geobacter sp. AOG1 TaxID=1566346 RepID=UPI001CC82E7B|nr:O-antigen translocase [Geobacter sp. AOG1]GFE58640.1 O-antigen translocase [Geobacter sp. AOG1]